MQSGIVVSQSDIKSILAKYFNVPESNVIQSKYSYVIVGSDKKIEEHPENQAAADA